MVPEIFMIINDKDEEYNERYFFYVHPNDEFNLEKICGNSGLKGKRATPTKQDERKL